MSAAGYLGAVAFSPFTTLLNQPEPFRSILATAIGPGLVSVFRQFKREDVLTEDGQRCLRMIAESAAGTASSIAILLGVKLLKEDLIHGEADESLTIDGTNEAVARTMEVCPSS